MSRQDHEGMHELENSMPSLMVATESLLVNCLRETSPALYRKIQPSVFSTDEIERLVEEEWTLQGIPPHSLALHASGDTSAQLRGIREQDDVHSKCTETVRNRTSRK